MNLIVGAGLSGVTLARLLADGGEEVLVIEKRNHIGGNVHDYVDKETGIRLSTYGAHIFHTNNKTVWDFVNRFSDWIDYQHKVLSYVNDKFVPVPVNITTVNQLFNANISTEQEMKDWLDKVQYKGEVKNSEDAAKARVGDELYELMFNNYTQKQWNLKPEQLEPSVLERIPVRTDYEDRYFTDTYQGLPKNGYTALIENILDHPNITVLLETSYEDIADTVNSFDKVFFTGKIDTYFKDKYGELEYRSLEFEYKKYHKESYQPNSVVNYPSLDYPYTRLIEYKKFYDTKSEWTIVAEERSTDVGEAYYPVPTEKNRKIFAKYQEEAKKLEVDGIYFVGRLAQYKYFNMDQAIASAIELYDSIKIT